MTTNRYPALALAALVLEGVALSQAPPAPTVDRVGFPTGYRNTFRKLLTFDRPDNGQIRVIWGNAAAANTPYWATFPYGSVILFESFPALRNADGTFQTDENGRFIPGDLATLFVKRKEPGFGEAYQQNRNGEWEYVAYRPDGSLQTTPQNSGACAVCHLNAGPQRDWTFRRERMGTQASGARPLATMSHYAFVPGDLTVDKGTIVTWYNDDEIEHQIFSTQGGFHSGIMPQGASFAQKFDEPGTYEIRCAIHAGMRSRVTVK